MDADSFLKAFMKIRQQFPVTQSKVAIGKRNNGLEFGFLFG